MGLFKSKKKDVLDLTERFEKEKERMIRTKEQPVQTPQQPQNAFSFFGNFNSNSSSATTPSSKTAQTSQTSQTTDYMAMSDEEKKRKLAKRLMDMTGKIEELSNQIYHLQQRIEVLEKRTGKTI